MSDIYDVFSLPAPPPPTFLSFYDAPDRARLPNFLASDEPVAAANKWLHGQIIFLYFPSLWYQVKIVTALAGLIVATAVAVIVRRLLQRSLWILRLKQTERGPLVVPNAIMIFAGTEGLFVIMLLALINSVYYAWDVIKQPLPNLILWITLTWSPLIAGPIWSSFGLWHARPPSSIPRNSRNGHRSEAVRLYYKWFEEHANATELTRPMLVELQTIWAEDLKAFYWLAITMFIWFSWTVILFVSYTFINLRLLLPLRAQLLALKDQRAKVADPSIDGGDTRVAARSGLCDAGNKSQIESVQLPLETPRLRSLAANYVGNRIETVDFQQMQDDDDENEAANAVNEHFGLRVKDLQEDAVNNSFFPPTKPSAVIRPATDSETSERYLRAAYRHFLFQGTTISVAIVHFGQISLYIALTAYSYNERRIIGKSINTAFLEAMWGCVFFTSLVFISITLRTYEPVLVSLLNNNNNHNSSSNSSNNNTTNISANNNNGNNFSANRSHVVSKDRSVKLNRLGSLRLSGRDSKMSFSSLDGTVVNSPTPRARTPAMDRLTENDPSDDEQKQWPADPESWGFTPNRGTRGTMGTDSTSISFTPITTPAPRRNNSVTSQTHLRKADILASTRAPEYEVPGYMSTSYDTDGMYFLASTSSLNDRSLREMPPMGTGALRRLDELPTSTLPRPASRAEASPRHVSTDRFSPAAPSSSISTNSGFMTTGGLCIGASLTPAGLEFVNALAGMSSMQSEEDRAKAHRSAFAREMLSEGEGEATVLPPAPRSGRRPSRTSIST
ncbi:unnamed protein product [Tilletia controversa]|nr:unnamed protein product [Tilletia controversa]CAD6969681.1 unnamed protein product [Tilletia controversa]